VVRGSHKENPGERVSDFRREGVKKKGPSTAEKVIKPETSISTHWGKRSKKP